MKKLFVFPNNDAGSLKIIKLIKKYNFNYCKTLSLKRVQNSTSKILKLYWKFSSEYMRQQLLKFPS